MYHISHLNHRDLSRLLFLCHWSPCHSSIVRLGEIFYPDCPLVLFWCHNRYKWDKYLWQVILLIRICYQLSIRMFIDKPFSRVLVTIINSWLIRLWVDNVLLINTRNLSIVIDKPIPSWVNREIPMYHSILLRFRSQFMTISENPLKEIFQRIWSPDETYAVPGSITRSRFFLIPNFYLT